MNLAVLPARRAVSAALAFLALYCAPYATSAQELTGRVLLGAEPVAGVDVELHRVTRDTAGVVGRTVTDPQGEFSFRLPAIDTADFHVFFATAGYLGVRYFGAPLHPGDSGADYSVTVYDTVSAGTPGIPLRVSRRDVVLLPQQDGGWEVNEIVRLENYGFKTLVSADGRPTWEFRIPPRATGFEVGEGELAASDLVRMDDRVLLLVPIVPGVRDVFVRYRVPGGEAQFPLPVDAPTALLNLYVQQPAPAVRVDGLSAESPIQAEGVEFARYTAAELPAAAPVVISWRSTSPPLNPAHAALAVIGVFLLLGAIAAVTRRGGAGGDAERPASRPGSGGATPSAEHVA
jgi:hypothetical protein